LKGTRLIVVSGLLLTGLLNASSTARAARVAVRIVPPFDPAAYAGRGAVGLMVPGVGGSVTRAGALASLERGKVRHALLGGRPSGRVLVRPSALPGREATIYVSLPPPGRSRNDRRYPVAVVGCGFHGLLTSTATRIPGLISVADVAPAVVHLRVGDCRAPPLGWQDSSDAPARLRALDHRIDRVSQAQGWILVGLLVVGGLVALARGSAGVLLGVGAVAGSLILSALGIDDLWTLIFGPLAIGLGLAAWIPRRLVPPAVAAFFVVLLLVLTLDTQVSSLAVLGAHLQGGGRFYGVTNQLETLLLAPTLAALAAAGALWFVPVAVLVLLTIGWSHAGADGGGIVVYAVAFAMLFLRSSRAPVTPRRLVLAAAAVVALVFAAVGIDAALGGATHVTHAVGGGPGTLFGDLGHRLHLSYLTLTSTAGKEAEFAGAIAVLVAIAAILRNGPTVDAMLVALVASFLVNDSPVDVAFLGALGCWTLVRWESVDSRAMRRPVVVLAPFVVVAVLLAGCGSQGTVQPLPQKVVGTIAKPSAAGQGKALFTALGCNACHTYKPAGSTAKIGPDLDKLPQYATRAKQPLAAFVKTSIVDPNAYVEKGFPKGVMPTSFKSLPPDQIKALVTFLTTKS
jgi:cytochrome c551/c552